MVWCVSDYSHILPEPRVMLILLKGILIWPFVAALAAIVFGKFIQAGRGRQIGRDGHSLPTSARDQQVYANTDIESECTTVLAENMEPDQNRPNLFSGSRLN